MRVWLFRSVVALAGIVVCLPAQQPGESRKKPVLAKDPGAFPLGNTQGAGPAGAAKLVAEPIRHLPGGRPDFGGDGAWYPGFGGNIAETKWKGARSADKQVDVPFLPWALQLFNERVESLAKDDPEAQCLPVGVTRYMFDPYPFKMIQLPDRVLFLFEGDNYPWREVNWTQA
jgi:hypothetical protein